MLQFDCTLLQYMKQIHDSVLMADSFCISQYEPNLLNTQYTTVQLVQKKYSMFNSNLQYYNVIVLLVSTFCYKLRCINRVSTKSKV